MSERAVSNFRYSHFVDDADYFQSANRAKPGVPRLPRANPTALFARHCDTDAATGSFASIEPHEESDTRQVVSGHPSRWWVTRVGPFQSKGGNDWHNIEWSHFGRLSAMKATFGANTSQSAAQMLFWITGFLVAPVDADGELIDYPPIHIHHAHLEVRATFLVIYATIVHTV